MFNSKYASTRPHSNVRGIPEDMLGFDTETTGLWGENREGIHDPTHEPISYGFVRYRNGQKVASRNQLVLPSSTALQLMESDPNQAAIRTHGFTGKMLQDSYDGRVLRVGNKLYTPAIDRVTGMTQAVKALADHTNRGGTIVGANLAFDLGMLGHHFQKATGITMKQAGFDLARTSDEGRIIDVIRNRWEHEGQPTKPSGDPKYTALSASKIRKPYPGQVTLCGLYGVKPGDHSAAEDARASIDVAINQIRADQGLFIPNERMKSIPNEPSES